MPYCVELRFDAAMDGSVFVVTPLSDHETEEPAIFMLHSSRPLGTKYHLMLVYGSRIIWWERTSAGQHANPSVLGSMMGSSKK
jgi:hypothetical protein